MLDVSLNMSTLMGEERLPCSSCAECHLLRKAECTAGQACAMLSQIGWTFFPSGHAQHAAEDAADPFEHSLMWIQNPVAA